MSDSRVLECVVTVNGHPPIPCYGPGAPTPQQQAAMMALLRLVVRVVATAKAANVKVQQASHSPARASATRA